MLFILIKVYLYTVYIFIFNVLLIICYAKKYFTRIIKNIFKFILIFLFLKNIIIIVLLI